MSRSLVVAVMIGVLSLGSLAYVCAGQPDSAVPGHLWQAVGVARASPPVDAPGFGLRDLAGRSVRLADFRGRLVMLYFWTTW